MIPWIAVILWMAIIFILSSQPAVESSKLSTGLTNNGIKVIEQVKPDAKFNFIVFERIIRKNAHFFVYLVLSILIMNALKKSGVRGYRCVIGTLLICILYAASDELHQVFVAGRRAQVSDVIIDSAGSTLGILLVTVTKGFWKSH
jgi:VanZ family protein